MAKISIYKNNPTAGATDGTAVSQNGAQTSPITATLNATISDEAVITLAIRADTGFETTGDTTFSFTGTNADKWKICATPDGTFSETLTQRNNTGVTLVAEGMLVVAA